DSRPRHLHSFPPRRSSDLMGEIDGAFRSWGFARGGTGAISNAIAAAAREAGVEIRTETAVARIGVTHGEASGVVLANGDELDARSEEHTSELQSPDHLVCR